MSHSHTVENGRRVPTRKEAAVFRLKAILLQTRRGFENSLRSRTRGFGRSATLESAPVVAESKTQLWTETTPEERHLVAGKIQNLRVALKKIDGVEVPAGETFSFWQQVGRTTRRRGFVAGRELREGCIIPNVGGGLCQLSNSLYDAALKANFEIVERHAHTQKLPGSLAEQDRDATVFWNYVDLRFRSPEPFHIEAKLDREHLTLRLRAAKPVEKTLHRIGRRVDRATNGDVKSCATCETNDCFRVVRPAGAGDFARTAYLVDEFSSEFDEYIQSTRTPRDILCLPLDGGRFRKPNYAWHTNGFARCRQSPLVTAVRSFRSRRLAAQGAARQINLLLMYKKLAESCAEKLKFDMLHVVVQQNLLPFLWQDGHLGGRTFDVLMSALPMKSLQERLDMAHALHPESTTLGDFRADPGLVDAEWEALAEARRLITPHSEIASLFSSRSHLLDWTRPAPGQRDRPLNNKPRIVFPASTVGRKGCYELREALRGLRVTLVTLGPYIEGKDFWAGFDVTPGGPDWLRHADLVALPAFVEHRPRRLLQASALGVPVVASRACGLENVDGVESVDVGDVDALRAKILQCIPDAAGLSRT